MNNRHRNLTIPAIVAIHVPAAFFVVKQTLLDFGIDPIQFMQIQHFVRLHFIGREYKVLADPLHSFSINQVSIFIHKYNGFAIKVTCNLKRNIKHPLLFFKGNRGYNTNDGHSFLLGDFLGW